MKQVSWLAISIYIVLILFCPGDALNANDEPNFSNKCSYSDLDYVFDDLYTFFVPLVYSQKPSYKYLAYKYSCENLKAKLIKLDKRIWSAFSSDDKPTTPEDGYRDSIVIVNGQYIKGPYKITTDYKNNIIYVNGIQLYPSTVPNHRVRDIEILGPFESYALARLAEVEKQIIARIKTITIKKLQTFKEQKQISKLSYLEQILMQYQNSGIIKDYWIYNPSKLKFAIKMFYLPSYLIDENTNIETDVEDVFWNKGLKIVGESRLIQYEENQHPQSNLRKLGISELRKKAALVEQDIKQLYLTLYMAFIELDIHKKGKREALIELERVLIDDLLVGRINDYWIYSTDNLKFDIQLFYDSKWELQDDVNIEMIKTENKTRSIRIIKPLTLDKIFNNIKEKTEQDIVDDSKVNIKISDSQLDFTWHRYIAAFESKKEIITGENCYYISDRGDWLSIIEVLSEDDTKLKKLYNLLKYFEKFSAKTKSEKLNCIKELLHNSRAPELNKLKTILTHTSEH